MNVYGKKRAASSAAVSGDIVVDKVTSKRFCAVGASSEPLYDLVTTAPTVAGQYQAYNGVDQELKWTAPTPSWVDDVNVIRPNYEENMAHASTDLLFGQPGKSSIYGMPAFSGNALSYDNGKGALRVGDHSGIDEALHVGIGSICVQPNGGAFSQAKGTGAAAFGSGINAIGDGSLCSGNASVASGVYSTSHGESNTASGSRSFVGGGFINMASGANSSCTGGRNNIASGINAQANGEKGKAAAEGALTMNGYWNEVYAAHGCAGGQYCKIWAGGFCAFAFGDRCESSAWYTAAIGELNIASGKWAFAQGYSSTASGQGACAIGLRAKATHPSSFVFGTFSGADTVSRVDGGAVFGGNLDVIGPAQFDNTLDVDGAATLNSTLHVSGNVNYTQPMSCWHTTANAAATLCTLANTSYPIAIALHTSDHEAGGWASAGGVSTYSGTRPMTVCHLGVTFSFYSDTNNVRATFHVEQRPSGGAWSVVPGSKVIMFYGSGVAKYQSSAIHCAPMIAPGDEIRCSVESDTAGVGFIVGELTMFIMGAPNP